MPGKRGGYHGPSQSRKGVSNKVNADVRARILKHGDPVGWMIRVMNGHEIAKLDKDGNETGEYYVPTMEHRLTAARDLLKKIVPDLKAIEISGSNDGSPVVFQVNTGIAPPNSEPKLVQQEPPTLTDVAGNLLEQVIDES